MGKLWIFQGNNDEFTKQIQNFDYTETFFKSLWYCGTKSWSIFQSKNYQKFNNIRPMYEINSLGILARIF